MANPHISTPATFIVCPVGKVGEMGEKGVAEYKILIPNLTLLGDVASMHQ